MIENQKMDAEYKNEVRRRVAKEILADQNAGKKLVRWQTDFIKFFPNFIEEAKND